MALWCRELKTAYVDLGLTPKRVSLIVPFYENHAFIQTQARHWSTWPVDVRDHAEVIVVDDGSPTPLPVQSPVGIRLRQYRIAVDVRWNWLAARNIGAHHAAGEWLLLTDMDHMVPADTMRAAIYGDLDPSVAYAFRRQEHTGEFISPHSASFLMTKQLFWQIGGYDERCSGYYGSDGLYRRRVAKNAEIQILTFPLIRHEYVGDSSTTTYKRKQPEDGGLKELVASFPKNSKPLTLSFPYHEVQL